MYKNLYYMLCYAVDELQYMKISDTDAENIKSSADLLAELLINTLIIWSKNNPLREYKEITLETDKPAGRINVYESYRSGIIQQGKLNCTQYRLNIDTIQNQIIKLALRILIKHGKDLSKDKRTQLNKYYRQFKYISDITEEQYKLANISYKTMPTYYKPVISASIIIINMMIAYNRTGKIRLYDLDNPERYKYIFEKFVRNFYKREYKNFNTKVEHPRYDISLEQDESATDNLDVLLVNNKKALVLDTKWYTKSTYTPANRHQIRAYMADVINHKDNINSIAGIVLYAKREDDRIRLSKWQTDIKRLGLKTYAGEEEIDITKEFDEVKQGLRELADKYMSDT